MTAAWHLGPIAGWDLWWLLVTSPEILVFLFFMITDPRTIPETGPGRRAYAVAVGLLAALLIAPWTTEFAHKLAVLARSRSCARHDPAARPARLGRADRLVLRARGLAGGRRRFGVATAGAALAVALLVVAGLPSRPDAATAAPLAAGNVPVPVATSPGLAPIDTRTARRIAARARGRPRHDRRALRTRDRQLAADGATGGGSRTSGPDRRGGGRRHRRRTYDPEAVRLRLERGHGQGPPLVVATLAGTTRTTTYAPARAEAVERTDAEPFVGTFGSSRTGAAGRGVRGETGATTRIAAATASFRLTDVAERAGLDWHGAFRYGVSVDPAAMMGGGSAGSTTTRTGGGTSAP